MAKSRNFHIKLPPDAYAVLEEIALKQRRDMAEVVREALEIYSRDQGYDVSFIVKKGGDRRSGQQGDNRTE